MAPALAALQRHLGQRRRSGVRTPAIVDFLIWYDQRCEGRQDVRLAVRRASAVLRDPDRWLAAGVFGSGKHEDVMCAVMGRPLAAMAQEHFVF